MRKLVVQFVSGLALMILSLLPMQSMAAAKAEDCASLFEIMRLNWARSAEFEIWNIDEICSPEFSVRDHNQVWSGTCMLNSIGTNSDCSDWIWGSTVYVQRYCDDNGVFDPSPYVAGSAYLSCRNGHYDMKFLDMGSYVYMNAFRVGAQCDLSNVCSLAVCSQPKIVEVLHNDQRIQPTNCMIFTDDTSIMKMYYGAHGSPIWDAYSQAWSGVTNILSQGTNAAAPVDGAILAIKRNHAIHGDYVIEPASILAQFANGTYQWQSIKLGWAEDLCEFHFILDCNTNLVVCKTVESQPQPQCVVGFLISITNSYAIDHLTWTHNGNYVPDSSYGMWSGIRMLSNYGTNFDSMIGGTTLRIGRSDHYKIGTAYNVGTAEVFCSNGNSHLLTITVPAYNCYIDYRWCLTGCDPSPYTTCVLGEATRYP